MSSQFHDQQCSVVAFSSDVTNLEKCLRMLFKCTYVSNSNIRCYFVCQTDNEFLNHLETMHPQEEIYCLYCFMSTEKMNKIVPHVALVEHIKSNHRCQIFQCNLCLYRAITVEHVNIHQKVTHSEIHNATINNCQRNKIRCKILVCLPMDDEFYQKYSSIANRFNDAMQLAYYFQCYFCRFMGDCKNIVVEHCIEKHPNYAILFYLKEKLSN